MAYRDETNTSFGAALHGALPVAGILADAAPGCVKSSAEKLVDFVVWLKSERPELMEPGKALRLLREAAAEYEQYERAKTPAMANNSTTEFRQFCKQFNALRTEGATLLDVITAEKGDWDDLIEVIGPPLQEGGHRRAKEHSVVRKMFSDPGH